MALIDTFTDKLEELLPKGQEFQCIPVYNELLETYYIQVITIWRYWNDYGIEYSIILDGPDYPYSSDIINKMVSEAYEVVREPTENEVLLTWIPLRECSKAINRYNTKTISVTLYGIIYVRENRHILESSGKL